MRKLLLTGTALIGSVGLAAAQTPAPMPMYPLGMPSQPSTYLGGNNMLNQDGGAMPSVPNAPTPGSMTIHLNGRVFFYAGFGGGSGNQYVPAGSPPGTPAAKLNPYTFLGYLRLYPGVDAEATNGLRYGAIGEIRQNFLGQSYGLSITPTGTNANNGAGGNYSTSPSGASCGSTLYVRREAVYIGSDQVGIFRLGQDDGPFSQFDSGVTTFQFGTGAWNGDAPGAVGAANSQMTFPFWTGVGAEYTVAKAVYFSPNFAGFDVAASFAPNNAPNQDASCPVASAGCAQLASNPTTNFGGAGRPDNWVEVMGRYRGTLGPVGLYGILGYSGSGNVKSTAAGSEQFNGFSVGDAGLVATIAGFSFGGNVLWGDYNGQVGLEPKGGNARAAVAWVLGAQYTNGPMYLAASYINYQSTGAWTAGTTPATTIGQRYDDGFAAGAGYALAPGLQLYAEYLYSTTHQGNVNLLTGGTVSTANNTVHAQTLIIGTKVQW